MLTRGQYNEGDIIEVIFDDGDITICRVLGENSTGEGIRCVVIEKMGGDYCEEGEKRTFKYGNNQHRKIKLLSPAQESNDTCEEEENNMGLLQELTSALKRVLSPELQAQFRAGFIGKDLELTNAGIRELLVILSQVYSKELTVRAKEVIEEVEKE